MNKVLQSSGRVIRTDDDTGAILLLDERFLARQYLNLFPREWFPYETVTLDTVQKNWPISGGSKTKQRARMKKTILYKNKKNRQRKD